MLLNMLQGRRIECPPPNEEFDHPLPDYSPGDYWLDESLGYWMICPPNGGVGSLMNHQVTVHDDGTISVSPSIFLDGIHSSEHTWHGYLKNGIWTEI
jgi:hypothetical protein